MAKKLYMQTLTVSGDNVDFINIESEGEKREVFQSRMWGDKEILNIPEKEVLNRIGFVSPLDHPEEITDLTDEEAEIIQKEIKEFGHTLEAIENILDNPKLSRIKEKLKKVI